MSNQKNCTPSQSPVPKVNFSHFELENGASPGFQAQWKRNRFPVSCQITIDVVVMIMNNNGKDRSFVKFDCFLISLYKWEEENANNGVH